MKSYAQSYSISKTSQKIGHLLLLNTNRESWKSRDLDLTVNDPGDSNNNLLLDIIIIPLYDSSYHILINKNFVRTWCYNTSPVVFLVWNYFHF